MSLGCANILTANELERYRVRLERTLPVKGKKEFSPSGSWVERKQLEAARDERHALLKEERVERVGTLSVAEWDEKTNVAVVTYSVGKHWENFGHQQGQIKCLHPEEALFLLETSNLLLLHNNVGLSVQQGYNTLLGQRTGCTLNCYRVFSHLARQGFRLKRHAGPVFALTDYERRIGLQSYLYPSRRSVQSVQGQPVDEHGDSASAEGQENTVRQITISEGNDNEIPANYIDNQHAGNLSESQVKTEALIPQASEEKVFTSSGDEIINNTVKNEDIEAPEFEFSNNNTVENSAGAQTDVSVTNFKSGKQHLDAEDRERIASESTSTTRSLIDKIKEESILTEMDSDVSMDANDTERIASESTPSTTRLIIDKIKEETIRTGNCDVLLDANARERIASESTSIARLVDRIKEEMIGPENYDVSLDANARERFVPPSTSTTRLLIDRIEEETIRTGNCDVLLDANGRERIASESTSIARLVDRIKEEMIGPENYDVSLDANARERISSNSASIARLLVDRIKEESIHTERNCDVSMDSTDSPSIIESVEELQEVDKHLNSREPQILVDSSEMMKENLKTSNEVCLVSDSSVSGFSDIIVDHEEQEQNRNHDKTPRLPPLVNLVSCNENKLRGRQSKMSTPQDLVIIDELPVTPRLKMTVGQPSTSNHLPKCDVQITNICSAKETGAALRTKTRKTIGGQTSSIKKSLKCEIDITDGSSAEECMSTCPDITNNKGDDILCIDHKHKPKRKRRISQRRSSVKSEKSYVVDVETDTLMHSDNNLVPRKVAKREKQKEISEVIVVDDIDTHSENDEAIMLKDDDLELELIKFYEEITLIDLTGEDSRTQTRAEILDMFPNFAGVTIATVRVPPPELLPENVAPSQQEYQIDLQKLLSDRPDWIVRRRPYRGRGGYQRFRPRRGHFRHQQYQGSPHRHMADERNYVDSHAVSEEFSRNVRMDYDRQSPSQNYSNSFSYPAQENMSFAVIDTSGDFSQVRRFEYHHRSFQARSNKQWYENTWNTASQSDGFMQQSDSPSASPQQYEPMSVDNRFAGHRHNQQRWNRRYHRNPSNRRNPSGRSKFRSFHHPSPYRHAPRTVNFQEETTEYDWQNIRKVSENAESWSHFKKLISGKNCEEPSVEPKQEIPMKVEENDDGAVKVEENNDAEEEEAEEGEEEPQVDSLDEEAEEEDVEWKPLLQPSDCTDIGSILQKLNIFKEVVCDKVHIAHSETRLKINYDIYLPTTKFKKSSPCLPDYRLCVVGCEEEVPSAGEISFLLKELRNDIPVPLLFAVVVPDSVSFYHFVNISLPVDDSCPA